MAASSVASCASSPLIWTQASSPGARQLASLARQYQPKHGGEAKQETRHFILSIGEGEVSHARLARIGREHWSVENKNHWRRDATRWREDRSACRKPNGAKNLALLRGAILALIPQEKFTSLNAAFDHYPEHRAEALASSLKPPRYNAPDQPIALRGFGDRRKNIYIDSNSHFSKLFSEPPFLQSVAFTKTPKYEKFIAYLHRQRRAHRFAPGSNSYS